ncbi:MAG: hypothetical protein COB53_09765 [Elusimicrobia bacterium]|nr:MAG: hypothetical protein COB53_09765 [Elusimicrobiota bacterium]
MPEEIKPPPPKPSPFEAAEWRNIIAALIFATLTLFSICALFLRDEYLATTLLSSIGMHAIGARAPAVLFCLVRGISPTATLFFNFYIEILIVFLCYYTFVLVVREGLESKFLHLAAKQAEAAAQANKHWVKKFEDVGLFLLVVAPLPMTGPVTGAIVGYLLNLRPHVTFALVFTGTFAANAVYVILGQAVLTQMITFQKEYQEVATISIAVIIAAFTIFHVRTIANWVEESVSDDPVD